MDDNIMFNPSAFRHGISKENIRHVIDFNKYERRKKLWRTLLELSHRLAPSMLFFGAALA